MTEQTEDKELDAAFERMLIESARDDGPPEGASRAAWLRFASVAGGAAAAASGAEAGGRAVARAMRRASAGWFVAGAVSGSALTAWLVTEQFVTERAPAASAPTVVSPSAVPGPAQRRGDGPEAAAPHVPAVADGPDPAELEDSTRRPTKPTRTANSTRTTSPSEPATSSEPGARSASTLAAEIEALDAARTALARRNFGRAFELTERYAREFPAGQLRADAAALGIEALAEQGNHVEAARRAELFLERYPNDPHRARVTDIARR